MGKNKSTLADALGAKATEVEIGGKKWTLGQATIADAELFHTMLEVLGMADKEEPQVDPLGLTENP